MMQIVSSEDEYVRFYDEPAAKTDSEESRRLLLMIADEEKKNPIIVENI